jgi:hypothetical protein
MKKKRIGKLSLSRETVRTLLHPEMGQAAGGTYWGTEYCAKSYVCFTSNGPRECAAECAPVDYPPVETEAC